MRIEITSSYNKVQNGYEEIVMVQIPCENVEGNWNLTNLLVCNITLLGEKLNNDWGKYNYRGYRVREKIMYNKNLKLLTDETENKIKIIKEKIKKIKPNVKESILSTKKIESIYLN